MFSSPSVGYDQPSPFLLRHQAHRFFSPFFSILTSPNGSPFREAFFGLSASQGAGHDTQDEARADPSGVRRWSLPVNFPAAVASAGAIPLHPSGGRQPVQDEAKRPNSIPPPDSPKTNLWLGLSRPQGRVAVCT